MRFQGPRHDLPIGQGFAGWLRSRRLERGLTQAELADLVGVHMMTISKWERGCHPKSAASLVRLARHFKVPEGEVLSLFRDSS